MIKLGILGPKTARLAFYVGCIVLATIVWKTEVYKQYNTADVLGVLPTSNSPDQLQQAQLNAFLEMNRLVTTLGTTLLGALGFFLSNRKANSERGELWAAFASFVCVALSLYYGYRGYMDLIGMLNNNTFDLGGSLISWDRELHFNLFLLGVFFFADFAFHELNREGTVHVARS